MTIMTENMDFERLEPIPVRSAYICIATSVVCFQLLTQIVQRAKTPKSVGPDDLWKWRNLFVSWIHALIIGTWDLSCFVLYPDLKLDLIAFHNFYIYSMVAFSTGYFVHDFIDILMNRQLSNMWEVIPHHIAVAGMFFYNLMQCRCIAYNAIALLAEVNTIFLHSRKLLQMSRFSFSHWLYRVNAGANIFTFVSCRFLALAWIVYGMFIWYDRVSVEYFILLASAMFVMWVTNVILFWRLLRSDILRRKRVPRSTEICAVTNGVVHKHDEDVANGNAVVAGDVAATNAYQVRDASTADNHIVNSNNNTVANGALCKKHA